MRSSLLSFAILSCCISASLSQTITASVGFWRGNGCCGASITFKDVKAGECVNVADPAVYGRGFNVEGIWGERLWPKKLFIADGYGVGWSSPNCTNKAWEVREPPQCKVVPLDQRAQSFSWVAETYKYWQDLPFPIRRAEEETQIEHIDAGEGRAAAPGFGSIKGADHFQYFDKQLQRSRKIALQGSYEHLSAVTKLYDQGDFKALAQYDETWE